MARALGFKEAVLLEVRRAALMVNDNDGAAQQLEEELSRMTKAAQIDEKQENLTSLAIYLMAWLSRILRQESRTAAQARTQTSAIRKLSGFLSNELFGLEVSQAKERYADMAAVISEVADEFGLGTVEADPEVIISDKQPLEALLALRKTYDTYHNQIAELGTRPDKSTLAKLEQLAQEIRTTVTDEGYQRQLNAEIAALIEYNEKIREFPES
jgi:hypothetical protein